MRQKFSVPKVWPRRKARMKRGAGGKGEGPFFFILGTCVCDPAVRTLGQKWGKALDRAAIGGGSPLRQGRCRVINHPRLN